MKLIEKEATTHLVPLIVATGLVGNTLNMIIYSRKTFNTKATPIGLYFRFLSLFDLVSVVQFVPYFLLDMYDIDVKAYSDLACKTAMFLLFLPLSVSVWLEATISIDRMFFLTRPYRFLFLKRRTFQFSVLSFIILANTLLYSPFIGNFKLIDTNQTLNASSQVDGLTLSRVCVMQNTRSKLTITWIDLINFFILPFILMLFSSVSILAKLYKTRENLCRTQNTMSKSRRRDIRDRQFAVSSILLNVIYIVCVVPITVINLIRVWFQNELTGAVFVVALHLIFIKFAVSFFVYTAVNSNFRAQLVKLFGFRRSS
jgi:hypothetical protein